MVTEQISSATDGLKVKVEKIEENEEAI